MLIYFVSAKMSDCFAYLENITLSKLKGAGSDVDAFSCLDLNAVHALMAVVIVHWIVGGQKNSLIVGDC